MTSLAKCLELHGKSLSAIEKKMVTDAADAYRKEGFKAEVSNTSAVEDILRDLEAEKADIVAQVLKQKPELKAVFEPEIEKVPVKEEPALYDLQSDKKAAIKEKKGEDKHALYMAPERGAVQPAREGADRQNLVKTLSKDFPKSAKQVRIDRGKNPERTDIGRLLKSFNITPVFWKTPKNQIPVNGVVNPADPSKIYLNTEATNPLLVVAGHEVLHTLRVRHPDLYSFLSRALRDEVVNFDDYLSKINANRETKEVATLIEKQAREELYGDFLGDQFSNPKFWEKLRGESEPLTRKLLAAVKRILSSLSEYIKGYKGLTDKYFKDIEKAQRVMANTLAEYGKRETASLTGTAFEFSQPLMDVQDASKNILNNPNFKKWFGDSKVVDADGKPLVVYHGTNVNIDEFYGKPIWLTPESAVASKYADRAAFRSGAFTTDKYEGYYNVDEVPESEMEYGAEGQNLVPVYIKMENPVDLSDFGTTPDKEEFFEYMKEIGIADENEDFADWDNDLEVDEPTIWKMIEDWHLEYSFKDAGYDGMIIDDVVTSGVGHVAYAVFDPTQIKSIFNRGTFSETDPRILYQVKEFDQEFKKDIEYFAGNFKESRPDITITDRIASIPVFHFKKVEALKGVLDAGLEWMDDKVKILRDLIYDENGNAYNAQMNKFKSQRKAEHREWNQRLVDNDANATGYSVRQNEDRPDVWVLYNPKNQVVEQFKDEELAWEKGRELEAKDYLTNSWASEQGAESLKNYRITTRNIFKQYRAGINRLIEKYRERGEDPPTVTYRTEEGNVQISLEAAKAKMGDRQGYYMPRLRPSGRLVLIAKKAGENPIRQHFDLGMMNPEKSKIKGALNYPAPIMRKFRRLTKQGYEVTIEKSDKMPEDVFLNLAGQRIAMSAIINKGLEGVSRAAGFKLSDIGLTGKWSTRRSARTQYMVNGKWLDESQLSAKEKKDKHFYTDTRDIKEGDKYYEITGSPNKDIYRDIMEDLGGEYYYKLGAGRGAQAWTFKDAPEDIEDQIKEMIYETTGINQDLDLIFAGELANQIANIEKSRGSLSRTIARSDAKGEDVWKGYEEDVIIALTKAAQGAAGGEAKRVLAEKMVKLMTGTTETWQEYKERLGKGAKWAKYKEEVDARRIDPTKQPNAYKDGMSYMENLLRNDEAADRVMGTIKGLAVLKYLGFRVAAPAVNLTALATTVPATMTKEGIPIRKVPKYLGRAMKAYHAYRKGNATPEWKAIFDMIHENGWHKSQYNKEALSIIKSRAGRGWDNFLEASMWMFGATEQLNRISTIAGAAKAFQDMGFDFHTAMGKAKEDVSDKAHGVYGKVNYPAMARGSDVSAQAIRSFYVFRTFSHHYLLNLKEMVGEGHYKAALYMTLSPAILAGAGASVLMPIVSLIGKMFGMDDPEEEFYRWAQNEFGDGADGFLRTGLMSFANMNLKGSLAVGIFDVPTNFKELFGAPGSMFSDAYEGGKSIIKGNKWKGIEKIMPINAAASMMKAVRESKGVTTGTDTPVFYGNEQLKASTLDSIIRFFSFNPASLSTKREKQWKEKKISYAYRDRSADIYAKIKRFYSLPANERSRDRWADILADIEEFNERALRAMVYIPRIDNKSIKRNLKRSFRPSRKEKMRGIQ